MATLTVEVEDQVIPWLRALAVVRGVEVDDLLRTALTHLRVTQTEKQRVAFYRYVEQNGTAYADDYTGQRGRGSGVAAAVEGPRAKRRT